MEYAMIDFALLSSKICPMKVTPKKLKQNFVGPFRVEKKIGKQAYGLNLHNN